VEQFSLSNVSAGDFVELRATTDTNGLLATRIERDDARNRVEVRGPARSVAAPNLTVGGVAVTTDDGTQIRDQDGDSIDAEAFFQAAGTGREVHVRGTRVGNAVLADEAELED
jgi:hypothetical protein